MSRECSAITKKRPTTINSAKKSRIRVASFRNQAPIFHLQNAKDDDAHITVEIAENTRKTGELDLSGRSLLTVPEKLFEIYNSSNSNININNDSKQFDWNTDNDDDKWWQFKSLHNLNLNCNCITKIPKEIEQFADLTVLNLEKNEIDELPPQLGKLTFLKELYLNHNKLQKLPVEFYNLYNLQILKLSHNQLNNLDKELCDLVLLTVLDLSHNELKKLPIGIGFLVRLVHLICSHNQLNMLPADIANLRVLSLLDVSYNQLEALPDLSELMKLQQFHAQHNRLTEVPEMLAVSTANCLEEIDISFNQIKQVPNEFFTTLPQLKLLNLRENCIETIEKNIIYLQHLIQLDLSNNKLKNLPSTIALLPHLQQLNLSGNPMSAIRTDIVKSGIRTILKHLKTQLTVDDRRCITTNTTTITTNQNQNLDNKNPIDMMNHLMHQNRALYLTMQQLTTVPEELFLEAQQAQVTTVDVCKNSLKLVPNGIHHLKTTLVELNLSLNQLEICPEFLGDCLHLKYLDVSGNCLNDLPNSLRQLTGLRELNLSSNWFTTLPECIFDMMGLEILLANNNQIVEINVDGLERLKRLSNLNLSNNSIDCLPPQLGNLQHIKKLELKGNCFRTPRYAILERGTESILSYLRNKIPPN